METVQGPDMSREARLTVMVRQYEKDLLRMCCVYLRDITLAQDAVQDTFLKAYQAMASFRGEASEKTWLMTIAMNVCRDYRRSACPKRSTSTLPARSCACPASTWRRCCCTTIRT